MNSFTDSVHHDDDDSNAIAIIGMTGRFPDAPNLDQFWRNLRDGVESVRPVSDDELLRAGVDQAALADKHYIKVASILDGIDQFDADFFGMSPREAELMDPQHRLFMECAWEALEHAGYAPRSYDGAIGLYAGTATSSYLIENIASNPGVMAAAGIRQLMMVNDKDFLCGRIAYELNLRGPAVVVQTACSTSLVAVHIACQSILNGECDIALAGGVAISNLDKTGYYYTEGGLYSADGHCRAFDANATGIIAGSGLGIVVLKSLANARVDGDTVHAIIRGSAINNDGKDKASFTAPSVDGQAAVISEAQAIAGVDADSISYLEAHGTGTMLGDPIEMSALKQAFGASTEARQFCALGSLKTNLGHLDVAAGVAGLIKTVLALKNRQLPPSLHFTRANPHIDFDNSPFFVNAALKDWPATASPRRAGVSSFGIGGTNAHAVLEEAMPLPLSGPSRASQVLILSARTPAALDAACANLAGFLESHPGANLADAACTLQRGREHFRYRRALAAADAAAASAALRLPVPAASAGELAPLVFMFPGGGTQYVNMGRELYESEAVYRAVIDECAHILKPLLGLDLRSVIYTQDSAQAGATLDQTGLALPALFATEYALVRQFEAWGIRPQAMVGHSLGEYVAACVAGVFSLADALTIVSVRGRLIGSLPSANMLAVLAPADAMRSRLGAGLWLACINSRQSCTISGTRDATEALAAELTADGIDFQLLQGWPASHSGLMTPIVEEFRAAFGAITLHAPALPYLSNLSGDWVTAAQATDPQYWVDHLCGTVRFADDVRHLLKNEDHVFLEVGPGHTLCNLLRREAAGMATPTAIASLPRRDAEVTSLSAALDALGQLWAHGAEVDWNAFYAGQRRYRIALPTYPFERQRYWIEAGSKQALVASAATVDLAQAEAAPRAALSTYARPALPTTFVAPQGATETALCAIWEEILGVAPVGSADDFFILGGNSLIAIQLASRIRAAFQVDVPLRTLFRASSVAAQAREVALAGAAAASAAPPLAVREAGRMVAPSFAQRRLCFIAQLDPAASAAYHILKGLRIEGPLDISVLQATLDRIVARQASLRTTFAQVDGATVQVIAPAGSGFALSHHDLSHLGGHEQESAAALIGADEGSTPFSLSQGPLIRARLVRLSANEHILFITQHHIISDGWSIGILMREVGLLYQAFSEGKPDPLPPLAIQYADYAAWQQDWLQGEVLRAQTAFWSEHLAGAPALLELPTDRPRPAVQSYAGGHVPIVLPPALTAAVRALGQRHGTTLFMTLLAGWSLLLARLSGQDDVVVGTPVANRQRTETEPLIGFFVNTLALRVRFGEGLTVAGLLEQVKASTLGAYDHQDLPFDHVVEALQPERSMSYGPLFQAMLNLHNTPADSALSMSGLTLSHCDTAENTAQCDLLLSLDDSGEQIGGSINYASDLFETSTVERIAGHFLVLLGAMASAATAPVRQLSFLTDTQRDQILSGFNDTAARYPQDELIHHLFEERAAAHPEALALMYDDDKVSYAQLNRRANQLAHHLLSLGVKPDDRVAICAARGVDMVVGLLGIMKAGAGYVPLDPAYPAERLAFMLGDCAPAALLTQSALAGPLALDGVPRVLLDGAADLALIDACDTANPDAQALGLSASHLAYVIYTSGSTGQPKGVMNAHRGLCNLARAQIDTYGVNADSRVLQFVSLSFDVCISEIAMALCSGASLHLAPASALLPGEPLLATLRAHRISHVSLPMAVLAALPADADLGEVHTLIVGGEALPPALADHWSARCKLFNSYGPTEATVCATVHQCHAPNPALVPIGRPLANTRIYILDAGGQPAPLGVTGEIHIGGVQVARGYLNRPELTAQRFIPDPFGPDPEARLYKTGDLGRWLADGSIDYLGRNDFQVKLRGFRIELGEIEARLLACEGVREAVVVAREDAPGDKRLVAYLVAGDGAAPLPADLRAQLGTQLAEYMVPAAFVLLEAFPLTPNGKVDRKALPAPDAGALVARRYEAPQGELETAIAAIWQTLLGVPQVGRNDHFFELGGYSLLATQFVARLRDATGIDLPLMKVFQAPILASLADGIFLAELGKFDSADINDAIGDIDDLSDEEVEMLLTRERAYLH
jgi:amino acid adenylation domain-containing protein